MTIIKSFIDLEQSKKLAEILPLKTADMRYEYPSIEKDEIQEPMIGFHTSSFNWFKESDSFIYFPCWSLAALLGVLPEGIIDNCYVPNLQKENGKFSIAYGDEELLCEADNPVDACYEMILKLHELNLL